MKSSELAAVFARIAAGYRIAIDREFAALGLNAGQIALLTRLSEADGRTQSELARQLGVSAPTVNKTVGILADRGLLRCAPCPDDGRSVRVFLSEAAAALSGEIAGRWEKAGERHFGALSDAEVLMLSMLLGKIAL